MSSRTASRGWALALIALTSVSAAPAWAACNAAAQARISPANQTNFPETTNGAPTLITLDGSTSNPAPGNPNQVATTTWELVGTPPVGFTGLSNANAYVATFNAPAVTGNPVPMTFKFTITCGDRTASATTIINITDVVQNMPPVAQLAISPNPAIEGETVTLDATGSFDPDLTPILTYAWEQTAGPTVTLLGAPGAAIRTFVAPNLPTTTFFTFKVSVTSSGGADSEEASVNVQYQNDPPVASLACDFPEGIQVVPEGGTIHFDGSASHDPDGQITLYEWSQDTGPPTIGIESETGSTVSLVAPHLGLHELGGSTITLKVTDNALPNAASDTAECGLFIKDVTPPVLFLPADITKEATSSAGETVTFVAEAQDAVDDATPHPASCTPASGSLFFLAPAPTKANATTVSCGATDAAGNPASGSFKITVQDTKAPVLSEQGDLAVEATSAAGAIATWTLTATDAVDGNVAPACDHTSGNTFPLGDTLVTCSATDARTNSASTYFTISVMDTTAPAIEPHENLTAEATKPQGANVSYTSPAWTDAVDGSGTANCLPASGSTFALGTTTVHCRAQDAAGNKSTSSFDVLVRDTTAPTLSLPATITEEATGPNGASVSFSATASDLVSGNVPVTCDPASGSTFDLGTTSVSCSATDAANNTAHDSFDIKVVDTTAPTLSLPSDITEEATGPSGAVVSWTATANDIVSGIVPVTCVAPSGSTFGLAAPPTKAKITAVACSASDAAGNTANGGFNVTVQDTTAPAITSHADVTVHPSGNNTAVATWTDPTASDIVSGTTTVSCAPPSGSSFTVLGPKLVTCSTSDERGNASSTTFNVNVTYATSGFFSPVDNPLTINTVQAGQAIPVKFGLGGNQGLAIFASGYPRSVAIACTPTLIDPIEETMTAGNSTLTYDTGTARYHYVWKTEKAWAGTCRQLQLQFIDGSTMTAIFNFKK